MCNYFPYHVMNKALNKTRSRAVMAIVLGVLKRSMQNPLPSRVMLRTVMAGKAERASYMCK